MPCEPSSVFLLPLTGKRGGHYGVVVGHARVADDQFTKEVLMKYRWHRMVGYAARDASRANGAPAQKIYLHQVVFEHYHGPVPAGMEVDHADKDRLNNTPENLRPVPHCVNGNNGKRRCDNTSGFKGVYFYQRHQRWHASMVAYSKRIFLGYHPTARAAADAVNRGYAEHFPELDPPNP